MRTSRAAEQALRVAILPQPQHYVCRACRAQAARQFHTSNRIHAELPFFKHLQQQLFGSKETEQAEKSREEKRERQYEELKQRGGILHEPEVKVGKNGQQYEIAALVAPSQTSSYVQAQTWDDLERIGSEKWVKARADRGEQYVGNKQWQLLLHHIVVEILVLQKAGRLPGEVCYPRKPYSNSWQHTRNADIKPSATGNGVSVSFAHAAAEKSILQAIFTPIPLAAPEDQQSLVVEVRAAVGDGRDLVAKNVSGSNIAPPWMDFSIKDPSVKMALVKRIIQLTGKRLPDPAISLSTTLADLYDHVHMKEKPKTLAEAPQMQRIQLNAPNVQVFSSRRTLIHKEMDIGRWKIIEEELVRRDLPVTGSRWPGAKAKWL